MIDCRGLARATSQPELRGVKGEMILIETGEVRLARPLRLIHPRWPLYVIPREDNLFMLGATSIEAEDTGVSVRSALELLGAAYAVHPAFGEARMVEFGSAFGPLSPTICRASAFVARIAVNGLYRHGSVVAGVTPIGLRAKPEKPPNCAGAASSRIRKISAFVAVKRSVRCWPHAASTIWSRVVGRACAAGSLQELVMRAVFVLFERDERSSAHALQAVSGSAQLLAACVSSVFPEPVHRRGELAHYAVTALIDEAESHAEARARRSARQRRASLTSTSPSCERSAHALDRPLLAHSRARRAGAARPSALCAPNSRTSAARASRTCCATGGSNAHRGAIWIVGLLVAGASLRTTAPGSTHRTISPTRGADRLLPRPLRRRHRQVTASARGSAIRSAARAAKHQKASRM